MKIAVVTPLPPARTGVADYAAAQIAGLRRHAEVVCGPAPDADAVLYHMGNNHLHRAVYRELLRRPGVTILHDAVLAHFYLGALEEADYIEEFVHNYGEWHRGIAKRLWESRRRSAAGGAHFRFPMLKRVAERSLAVAVHNPAAGEAVRRHAPQATVVEIPHLFTAPVLLPGAAEVWRLRQKLGIPPQAMIFGVFGHLRESKRLYDILRAFTAVQERGLPVALLVAGEFVEPQYERALAPWLAAPGVFRVGYAPEAQFWTLARMTDSVLNLRYPSSGETSGIGVRLMGIGKPVAFTEGPEIARLPEGVCFRMPSGPGERAAIEALMERLVRHPGEARAVGEAAAKYIARHHAIEIVTGRLLELLEEVRKGAK